MDFRQFFFQFRGFTPVPFILIILVFANPSIEMFSAGFLIATFGEFIRIWGVGHAGRATRTRNVGADVLVTSGPFRYVRNPLYLGNLFIYTGFTLLTGVWFPWAPLIAVAFFLIQYYFIVSLEEEFLQKKFGSLYQNYRDQVPRFIPRFNSWNEGSSVSINLPGALRSERSTLLGYFIFPLLVLAKWYFFLKF